MAVDSPLHIIYVHVCILNVLGLKKDAGVLEGFLKAEVRDG
jgi:hypothetical protein